MGYARAIVSPRWLLVAALALLFVALLTIIRPAGHIVGVDLAVAQWVSSDRSSAGITFFTAVSVIGSARGLVPIALVLAGYLYRRGGARPVWVLALTMLGASLLYLAVNVPVERARPPLGMRLYEDAAWSFPSGHSTQAAAFWLVTAVLVTVDRSRRTRLVAWSIATVAIGLIGFSRIYLGAHWTTDVLGGFSLGGCWVATILAVRPRLRDDPRPAGGAIP